MLTSDFDYNLPKELIAQYPADLRDSSRLMVVDRVNTKIVHERSFSEIVKYLRAGDLVVWNNTKVFKARLRGTVMLDEEVAGVPNHPLAPSLKRRGKFECTDVIFNAPKVEIFLTRPMENPGVWRALAKPGRKLRLGMKVVFAEDFSAEVMFKNDDGTVDLQFNDSDAIVRAKANKYGEVPTPPYIKNQNVNIKNQNLVSDYQTVYAQHEGSVAAPTAGFHFTEELIERLKKQGVEFAEVTLHVGLGTFLPVKTEKVEDHKMHAEWVEITDKNAGLINAAKASGRRVVAVGTTTVRTLEGVSRLCHSDPPFGGEESLKLNNSTDASVKGSFASLRMTDVVKPYDGDINIFITPGFKFKVVDALITNFHLPESTLLMLVSAFVGDREFVLDCYEEAIKAKYRFYSFGDAMLIV
ncbi:MAG: hypothetical protein A2538_03010 [Candidatus Magasanikbacteria bacterium RIFOXYD2_FULL_41_14]|uniref:S-adenosylmethionine:tRNA ribosyltransferase-isomerase n=1 Tax=Candidatus Magasanikbacteria bacterium RIFOXYD2_FULL_41_14 TaxID=1798709 RepID=A0A1F6PCB7_9BACT|nr:MAG: hypothetical protein A2538_03010 [Candidatus Magasanikbacteria bacterium RIFOXYD2_FULL_41_14]